MPEPDTAKNQLERILYLLPLAARKDGAVLEEASEAIDEAMDFKGFSVVILTGECMIQVIRREGAVKPKTHVVKDTCIGCKACFVVRPTKAISETKKQIGMIYLGKNYDVDLVIGERGGSALIKEWV